MKFFIRTTKLQIQTNIEVCVPQSCSNLFWYLGKSASYLQSISSVLILLFECWFYDYVFFSFKTKCFAYRPHYVTVYSYVVTLFVYHLWRKFQSHAASLTFQSSSSLLICWAVICLALSCSCSEGIFTSQERKQRSWIRGCHWELSQLISFRLLWLAQGCLNFKRNILATQHISRERFLIYQSLFHLTFYNIFKFKT